MILLWVVEILIGAAILTAFWKFVIEPLIRFLFKSNTGKIYNADQRLEEALTELEVANIDRDIEAVEQEIHETRHPKTNA